MCGKFTAQMTWGEYCALAGIHVQGGAISMPADKVLGTFTPMSNVPVLYLGPGGRRRVTAMRWGWHDGRGDIRRFSHLHARAETIDSTPAWIEAFHERRGVVFTKTFNIGETLANGKTRQWVCSRADGEPVAIAVIFAEHEVAQGALRCFVMVTAASSPPIAARDERMPALLANEEEVARWLGEDGADARTLKALLRPYEGSIVMREQAAPSKPSRPAPKTPDRQPELF